MDTDELGPVSQRRAAFGESLMKIETAFAYYQTTLRGDDEIDYDDAIEQYRRFDDLYRLLETELNEVNTAMKDVFTKAKAEKRDIPYTWKRFRTDVLASDREIQLDKLFQARLAFIAAGIETFETKLADQSV